MPATLDAQFAQIEGLRTRHIVRGAGPPVLVLHGWGASIEAVMPIVAGLAPIATVHALDLPGFGESELPPEPWGVEDYQRFVAAYMDTVQIGASQAADGNDETGGGGATGGAMIVPPDGSDDAGGEGIRGRAAIVAHSNGGRVAIRMAATEPWRVGKLVLVDSAGIRPRRTFRWYRRVAMAKAGKHAARLLGGPGERLRDALVGKAGSADYLAAGAMRPTLVRLVNSDLREHMPNVKAPTLLIWGADDTDTPVAAAREMERLIPDAGLVLLEGAGHFSYLDKPQRFARIVSHFIAPPPATETDAGGIGPEGEAPA